MERWEAEPGDSTEAGLDLGCYIQYLKVEGVGRGETLSGCMLLIWVGYFVAHTCIPSSKKVMNTPVTLTSKEVLNTPVAPTSKEDHEFEANLGYLVKLSYREKKISPEIWSRLTYLGSYLPRECIVHNRLGHP